jgi:hypothetical protein
MLECVIAKLKKNNWLTQSTSNEFKFVQKPTQFPINRNSANVQIQSLNSNSSNCYSVNPQQQSELYVSLLTQHAFNINIMPKFRASSKIQAQNKGQAKLCQIL